MWPVRKKFVRTDLDEALEDLDDEDGSGVDFSRGREEEIQQGRTRHRQTEQPSCREEREKDTTFRLRVIHLLSRLLQKALILDH